MTEQHVPPAAPAVETKVKAATAGAVLTAFALWVLARYVFKAEDVPGPVAAVVGLAITGAVTSIAGYVARHTPRPDLPSAQR